MPFCEKCGRELKAGYRFCASCGTPTSASVPFTQVYSSNVPVALECGVAPAVLEGGIGCETGVSTTDQAPSKKPAKKKIFIVAAVLVIVLAVAALLVVQQMTGSGLWPTNAVTFSGSDIVRARPSAHIVMYGKDGEPLSDYDLTTFEEWGDTETYHVDGDSFVPEELGIDEGSYSFGVYDSDTGEDYIVLEVDIDKDAENASQVGITPPEDGYDSNGNDSNSDSSSEVSGSGVGGSDSQIGGSLDDQDEHQQAQSVAQGMADVINKLYASDMSEDALKEYMSSVVALMPIDVVAEKSAMTTSDEEIEEALEGYIEGMLGSLTSLTDSLSSYLDCIEISVSVPVGDRLDAAELADVEAAFSTMVSVNLEVEDGYKLGMDVSMTATDDIGIMSKGDTSSQSVSSTGLLAIKIDGSWYLWSDTSSYASLMDETDTLGSSISWQEGNSCWQAGIGA